MKSFETKKLYYSIGEVSRITSLPSYLLRYWESEFPQLVPSRNQKGNRIYTNKDIATVLAIKNLIQDHGYTIEKSRELLNEQLPTHSEVKQTETLLKEHQVPVKPPRESAETDRRRNALLQMKATIEDVLERFP
jgi:DNA-binding transcriptional MerR regulator